MLRSGILTIFFSVCGLWLPGQHLYFCERYSSEGIPSNISNRWKISDQGGYVFFLYDQENELETDRLSFFVDLKEKGEYREFDIRSLEGMKGKSWGVLDYKLTQPGDYRVTVLDANQNELVSEFLTVTQKDQKVNPDWYQGMEAIFCMSVKEGEPQEVLDSLVLPIAGEASLALFLKLGQPLQTYRILVDVWLEKDNKLDKYLETLVVDVESEEDYTDFLYQVTEPGNYRFMVYNEEQVFMKGASIRVSGP